MQQDPLKSKLGHTVYATQHILEGVSGSAESGQLLAIIGPTGCGKTSLLNVCKYELSIFNHLMNSLFIKDSRSSCT
jgi:ABC-type lipoprotein export system ATPase subunit